MEEKKGLPTGRQGFLTREELLGEKKPALPRGRFNFKKLSVVILGILLFADLGYLNLKVLDSGQKIPLDTSEIRSNSSNQPNKESVKTSLNPDSDICPESCISQIDKAVSKNTRQTQTSQVIYNASVKEFYIPFGSGMNSSDEWSDIPGLQAYIDFNSYGSIKKVTFEASVRVPTGNQTAGVRLFNVAAAHPVWFSEVTFTGGGTPQLLISQPITLDSGNNLYKIQMKTQLKYNAYLDQARVHITTY